MFPHWDAFVDVTIIESLSSELTKGSVSLSPFLPQNKQILSLLHANKQLLCLRPDRFDARKATRLHCHTQHTSMSIRPLSASSTPPCCLPATGSSDMTHACQTEAGWQRHVNRWGVSSFVLEPLQHFELTAEYLNLSWWSKLVFKYHFLLA